MTPSRTVLVGSALPLLLLIGLVGFPSVRVAIGLERPEPLPLGSTTVSIAGTSADREASSTDPAQEALSLARLRWSISAGHQLAFTGTEIVSGWHPDGSTTRVLDLAQGTDGVRTASARNAGDGSRMIEPGSNGDALAGLSDRALEALAASYELRAGGSDWVAGRAATVVVAAKNGREAARMWLDDRTGLLLRQDVFDSAGRLHRSASFVSLNLTDGSTGSMLPRSSSPAAGTLTFPAARRSDVGPAVRPSTPAGPWSDVVSPAELSTLRADGWPCPAELAAGFVLLDARRSTSSGGSTVHLTYGDGLSAISVFLQRGELDPAGLGGLTVRKWGDTEVYVRAGWPAVMVWQGGSTVITAIGDTEPTDPRTVLGALPRTSNHGTLGSLQQRMGSALAWFRS